MTWLLVVAWRMPNTQFIEGQKVEITGTVEKSSTTDEKTAGEATTPTPKLHVASITTVSSTCSR